MAVRAKWHDWSELGRAIERISGISVWQFNDIKADPSDFHPGPGPQKQVCKSCTYSTAYDASTPMNCSSISTSCFRPGGENHKGVLDFWRREKPAFTETAAKYKDAQRNDGYWAQRGQQH